MKRLIVLLVALPLLSWGQGNLVPNGGFEEFDHCPDQSGIWSINAFYWTNAGGAGSPDYYHECAVPNIFPPDTHQWPNMGVPANLLGHQDAHSGQAYIGIYCFSATQSSLREYIQAQLTDSIVPTVRYLVRFHASFADNVRYSVSTIGAHFSKEPIVQDGVYSFDVEPHIVNTGANPLTSKEDWVLITDTFSSRYGGERYLTIGNFNTDATSDTLYHFSGDTSWVYAYYYIDDVSVVAIDSIPESIGEDRALQFSVHPNPATEAVRIEGHGLSEVQLLDISGRTVLRESIVSNRHTLRLAGVPAGLYLVELRDAQGRRAAERIVIHERR